MQAEFYKILRGITISLQNYFFPFTAAFILAIFSSFITDTGKTGRGTDTVNRSRQKASVNNQNSQYFTPSGSGGWTLPLGQPQLVSVKRIWDAAPHCAFTDLKFFKGYFYCTFREGKSHRSDDGYGSIRVIRSTDGANWTSTMLFSDKRYDLRDPKLTIDAANELMLSFTACKINTSPEPADKMTIVSMASFSADGLGWTDMQTMEVENQCAWRVTWNRGSAYTVGWHKKTGIRLYKSRNGLNYMQVCKFKINGFPNETSLLFLPGGKLMALVRREEMSRNYYLGESKPPYTSWTFKEGSFFTGGPNMIQLPDSSIFASFRSLAGGSPQVVLSQFNKVGMSVRITFPSGGDCGYPGMVWHDNALWVSYYSSHEENTSIYLAKVIFK